MVRLVRTDFPSKEDSEFFHITDELDSSQNIFTYSSFKKYEVYLSKNINEQIYSLNLLSKKYLDKNQLLIYVSDSEYIILFNHRTVYSAKINQNFITDDIIKSILITRHIAMLSSGGDIENIYYVINSKYKSAIENILKQNTKNEKHNVVAKSLGEIKELIKHLNELDTSKTHYSKIFYLATVISFGLWLMFYGLNYVSNKIFYMEPLDGYKQELRVETQLSKRQEIILANTKKSNKELFDCITTNKVLK